MHTCVWVWVYATTHAGVHTAGWGQGQGLGYIFRSYTPLSTRPIYNYISQIINMFFQNTNFDITYVSRSNTKK